MNRENGAASLLIRNDGKKFVLANKIEMPRMLEEEISAEDFEPVEFAWEDEKTSSDFVTKKALSLLENNKNLGADLFLNTQTPIIESDIARCRYQLTDAELKRFRQLGKDAGETVGDLIKTLQIGENEIEIARRTTAFFVAKNISSVVTLVAADERMQKFRHPVPTEKCWEKVLMIVVCAKRKGLIASLSRIVCAGKIPDELRRRTDACASVKRETFSGDKTGCDGRGFIQNRGKRLRRRKFCGRKKNGIIRAARRVTKHAIGSRIRIRRRKLICIRLSRGILR